MNFIKYLEKQNTLLHMLIGFSSIGIISILNLISGYKIYFFLFYLIPISLMTWSIGHRIGILASFISVIIWFWFDTASGHHYINHLIPFCNSLITLLFYVIITLLLSKLKVAFVHEKELASIDNLTGAVNSRLFFELLQMEIERLQRYKRPFTLVYFDLDNFKEVNDHYGHLIGNQVLRGVVNYTKNHLRKVDIIARLGGDEFAVLLPETCPTTAKITVTRFQNGLLKEMQKKNWAITFSIAVVTCKTLNCAVDELMKIADNLMYAVKRNGKNAIEYSVITNESK
jgi:diguanylate cyclase (GGDEF)-like protein